MSCFLFNLCSLGMLLYLSGREKPSRLSGFPFHFFKGFVIAIFISVIFFEGLQRFFPAFLRESVFPLSAVLAYAASRLQKKPALFPLILVASLTAFPAGSGGLAFAVLKAAGLGLGAILFAGIMEGIRFRLLFSSVPKPLAGLPADFLAAAIFSLALAGIFGG